MALKPPIRRGMKELDRSAFTLVLPVVGLRVPVKSIGQIKSEFPEDILKLPRMRNVVDDSATHKLVLLNPQISLTLDKASDRLRALVREHEWQPRMHDIQVGYETWTADDILKAVLPSSSQAPTSYEQIGHIAHMNLREEFWEYKKIIGQVILDKSPTVTMVVNKLDTIDNTFRNFKMEVLAGEPQFIAQVKENDCVFRFDYSKVYWNSRLHGEHERLVKQFREGQSVCDVMAGVGPFAMPAAKRGVLVWANDLNPASYAALCDNVKLNKLGARVKPFNLDGREFIRTAFMDYHELYTQAGPLELPALKPNQKPIVVTSPSFDHVVMNLPAIALEFLDAFRGIFAGMKDERLNLPTIHVHCFTKSEEPEKDILTRACRALGVPEDKYDELDAQVFYVRKVAPNKDMYCLSLKLPQSVAYSNV
ncbi:tRNA(m(1)G37)methyltransferase [Coemansia sp. RSA 2336]|nr:tRNA(m(1)G37)methyltransferase [Coemansia sp. RSA 2336]